MHNESKAVREPENIVELEPIKPSKFSRIKSAAITVGIIAIPTSVIVGGTYANYRIVAMALETAKINLEIAKLKDTAVAVTQS